MRNIPPGYAFLDNFSNPGPFDICRASRVRDNRRVLIKTSPIRHLRHGETLFRHLAREYEFCTSEGLPGIVRALDLVKFGDHAALVLEDEGGDPLHRILASGPLGLETALAIAMQLAKILFDLHHDGLIHQSIRPSNILVTPGSLDTRITGLGMATRIPRSWSRDISNADLENELAFISPEQTGRTNRLVDYRTDFYSLGITLYKTVTGRLPFPARDVLDLVHAHLAMDPPDPTVGSPDVPLSLSRVILKLMSKEAEYRYQGGLGLLADLEQCRRESTEKSDLSRFALGEHDFPDRFELPQKLYGRDTEIRKLTQGFDAACDGSSRLILVSGYSGVGKTSLIHEFGKTVFLRRGHFASGRYELQERSIPYSGILEAARNLVRRLLGESPEHFSSLRKKLSDALGSNIGVLVDVIPEMGAILGDFQQPVILGPTESRNRFHNCMLQFFEIAAREAPLVLFLDDLQWADQPSLELIEGLLLQKAPPCLLVGSYRDNEVDENHPFAPALERIKNRGLLAEMLAILPLGSQDVLQLVADTLRTRVEHARPLADLVFQKTAGNPFFVKSFMASLHVGGHLKFLPESGWTWDLVKVAETGATENVIDFTARKIDALPAKIRETISLAAALGGRFDTQSISEVSRLPIEEIRAHLIHGSRERILVKREDHFEFEHDRIRESAYGLIPENAREATHLNIGRLLAKKIEGEADDSRLFESVNHLNSALRLIENRSERMEIARLNQRAGRRAKSGGAFQAAFRYFAAGLSLLDDSAWIDHYLLALEIHSESAEAAFLNADFEEVDRLVAIVLLRAHSVLDRISAYETQIGAAYARRREGEALAIMLDVLKLLGIEVPFHPSAEDVDNAIQEVHAAAKKMLDGSLSPRRMDDPTRLAATRLLVRAAFSAGWTNLSMYWLIVGKIVDLTVRYGHGPEAPVAYVMAGSIIACEFKEYEDARTIGSVGLTLCENPQSIHWRALCQYLFNLDIVSHVEHFPSLFHRFAKVHRIAIEGGDLVSASTSAFFHCHIGLHMGMELHKLGQLIRTYFEEATTFCVNRVTAGLHQLQQTILLLMGTEPYPENQITRWNVSADMNLRTWHGEADQTPQELTYSNRMMIQYFLRDSKGAWDSACIADTLPEGGAASVIPSDFYICLCFLDIASDASDRVKDQVRNTIAPRLENLRRMALASPMNHCHKMDLVEAERQRVFGSPLMAMSLYEKAIAGARKQGFVNDEAIGNELTAEFYLSMNNLSIATMYLQEAESAYERWGAGRKITQLQEKYRYLLSPQFAFTKPAGLTNLDTDEEVAATPVFLDTSSFEKAASALAGELDLSRLIRKLMAILLQNTGAQRGFLLREEEGVTLIVASGSVDEQGVDVLRWDSLESSEELSQNIVRYVQRSHESVVIGDAVHNNQFAGDPYIESRHPLSILCTPILHRGIAVAILYLENNRMCDAFVGDRLAAVQFISSQAAVALENAQLHESLMREVVVRRTAEEELRKALGEVAQLKDRLEAENLYLREELQDSHSFKELVGRSRMLMDVLRKADQVASTGATVLILGETGTGKELIAREIHSRSTRKDRPLVKVNCAALPGPLIESELFGHEKGAFTGALAKKIGRFELADGGTIFLDEVGDLPLDLQAKLLRVLQEGEFERLGSNRTIKVDVRVIAATNRDLKGASVQGVFRPDLYYRLSVFPIQLPSLRERREDIPMLVRHFLKKKQTRLGKNIEKIQARIMDQLVAYHWPGNVRELENVIERAIILSPGPTLELEESLLHVSDGAGNRAAEPGSQSLEEAERSHILAVLEQCGWKIKGSGNTANQLGLNPSTLYFRMKKLGIKRPAGTA